MLISMYIVPALVCNAELLTDSFSYCLHCIDIGKICQIVIILTIMDPFLFKMIATTRKHNKTIYFHIIEVVYIF